VIDIKKGKKENKSNPPVERRKYPRFFIELPLDYSRRRSKEDFGGVVKNLSEKGILVCLPENLDIGELLKIEIYFAKGPELNTIKGTAKVIWSDLAGKEILRENRYGLKFISIQKETLKKLRNFLKEIGKNSISKELN